MVNPTYIRWLDEIRLDDVALVGGKNASLGELAGALHGVIKVPETFAITAEAYRDLIDENGIWPEIEAILTDTDWSDLAIADGQAARIRVIIDRARLPGKLVAEIEDAYARLCREHGRDVAVAVRSSATAEDLPGASFAGQHETYLNVTGPEDLLSAVSKCFASLFTQRAISYRITHGFEHRDVALSVSVQRMIRADQASSGVIFTLDTESGHRDVVMITGLWGLGEAIVQGVVDPDEFLVHKPTLAQGYENVLRHRVGSKARKLVYAPEDSAEATVWADVEPSESGRPCLADRDIIDLAKQAVAIEAHYSQHYGRPTPMDIEWARDGSGGALYILQARPETVHSTADAGLLTRYHLDGKGEPLVTGQAVGDHIGSGPVRLIDDAGQLEQFQYGDILVATATTPDWEPAMKKSAAVITEHGGRTCHAAIVARELGIPVIVGAANAKAILSEGQDATVDCSQGVTGQVLDGLVPFTVEQVDISAMEPPAIDIMVNIADPGRAFRVAMLPVAGVGLARVEFIIANTIRAHPMALLEPHRISDEDIRRELEAICAGHASGADYFISRLAEGIATIAAAFHPRPVIVRTSDFKSNEYGALLGGADFESAENNPMIGFRGAGRYIHPSYAPAFALECEALRRVRDDMGFGNVIVMIPFCRRLQEARDVLSVMADHGLRRGGNGLEIYMMCEIPSNAVLVDEFAALFDGFSIGSNDLTQLVLGVDRDSEMLAADFDEEDEAVKRMIVQAIEGAHRHGLKCGICGQAPSDRPAFAQWLVAQGIDSMSLTPDGVLSVMQQLASNSAEKERAAAR